MGSMLGSPDLGKLPYDMGTWTLLDADSVAGIEISSTPLLSS